MKTKIFLFALLISQTAIAEFEPMKHVVRREAYWGDYKRRAITEKLLPASPEVIDYITQDNIKNGWPNRPKPAVLSEKFRTDIVDSLNELPADISQKINKKLTGIVIVNDLGGSAYNEYVHDANGKQVAGFVILDISALDKTANEWATWKEQSPFKQDPSFKLIAEIEKSAGNNRKNALQYILLHEFGHVLSIGLETVAPWGIAEDQLGTLDRYKFTDLSWKIRDKKFVSIFDGEKLDRTGLRYYGPEDKRLPTDRAKALYRQLENTNFPTLYAATNPFDDFAESFVSYVHSVRLKRPWKITISSGGNVIHQQELCWSKSRCQAKRAMLEQILEKL